MIVFVSACGSSTGPPVNPKHERLIISNWFKNNAVLCRLKKKLEREAESKNHRYVIWMSISLYY
jgi:hypothetical protein